jgi:hypothetical protein
MRKAMPFRSLTLSVQQVAFIAERTGEMSIFQGATVFG